MKYLSVVVSGLIVFSQMANAENLLGKIADGATGIAKNIDESIVSTEELVSNEETPELTRQRLDAHASETLNRLFAEEPDAVALFDQSAGFGVFDTRRVGLIGVSGGFGRGVAVSKDTGDRTYMQMGTGGVNLSLSIGGFDRQVVILFENLEQFDAFATGGYDATADAGAMFGEDKTEETVRFVDGRSVFVLTKKGWKVSASLTGTKYWIDDKLN